LGEKTEGDGILKYRIGIPRALMYYQFGTIWKSFFHTMDTEVIVSGETNKKILDEGATRVVDEACLPVKVYFGHAMQLAREEVDFLFIPRLVSIEKKAFICPKLMGLPDMLSAGKSSLPPLIKPTLNLVKSESRLEDFLQDIAKSLSFDKKKTRQAWHLAQGVYNKEMESKRRSFLENQIDCPGLTTIFLAAHPYLIHDRFLNLNIVDKLKKMGCRVILPEEIPPEVQNAELSCLRKPLFWSFGKMQLGSVRFIARQPGAKGIIILSSFGCGIDSFIDNMVVRYLKKMGVPYLNIILDEHSGAAGLDTRIEAFLDMLRWKESKDEDYVSTYGSYLGCDEGTARASGAGCSSTTLFQ